MSKIAKNVDRAFHAMVVNSGNLNEFHAHPRSAVVDILANVKHYCIEKKIDFDFCLSIAANHVAAELDPDNSNAIREKSLSDLEFSPMPPIPDDVDCIAALTVFENQITGFQTPESYRKQGMKFHPGRTFIFLTEESAQMVANMLPDEDGEDAEIKQRLEYLRGELRAERISISEIVELESLAQHIEPGDVELLEAAGVPEFPEKGAKS